jgi:3-deoxy-manno-octulosonate cytidylyltransferase (CMP-KDO synthetase)
MLTFAGIIPARYGSTRFPGKPLVMINGKTMIERVYIQASKVFENVCVATDDSRIETEVKRFGGHVIMTSENHQSGTDRCAEAIEIFQKQLNTVIDVVVNIQGDEPFVQPGELKKLIKCFDNEKSQIATLVRPFTEKDDMFSPNCAKVIRNKYNQAIYFSRAVIPFLRNKEKSDWPANFPYLKQIGIYAYRTEILKEITKLPPSLLELAESLEQLRWIENGYVISLEETDFESICIDTPEDLENLSNMEFTD